MSLERQIAYLEKLTHVKAYYEVDNEIPHIEGGIPILDQH